MTVEQTPLDHFGPQSQETQMVLNQLKEITGVNNVAVLGQALEASKNASGKYDLHHAVNILVDENSAAQKQQHQQQQLHHHQLLEHPLHGSPNPAISQSAGPNNSGVIDLTNDSSEKEDDLQKAIALSLKEQQKVLGGQVSVEDQDISRVVEASLAESKAVGTKRKRGEAWQDPLNPHDRKRIDDWPVGLKNVGNTCWFSAVIQSLFHLPIFRQLVLKFMPQNSWSTEFPETKEQRNLRFMQELRKLFALMLCSKRKYVDPSHALEELKEAFPDSNGTDSQQDVSEFSHKLLEWLEEAFKLDSAHLDSQSDTMMEEQFETSRNPMLDLFYGQFRSEGHNEGRWFSNKEAFGQYPLQVNGFNDIHESLEAAMAQEIESYNDGMSKSGQESWFTRLPPVLLFELSRFQFNQQLGRPEKIHNKLEFPEIIFMDRYMEYNKDITRSKREQVRQLKEQRDKFQSRLEKYLNYGSGAKRVPLHDVLQYTLEFVESKKSAEASPPIIACNEDVEMASPCSSMGNDSPCDSPNKVVTEVTLSTPQPTVFRNPLTQPTLILPLSDCVTMQEVAVPTETKPSPQHVSDVELRVLQSCLRRWRTEVESDVKELQDRINKIDCTIRGIYTESSLQKEQYRLHAVLVHEGQAASGHYWAYVYSPRRALWLKFNDITVTDASWAELQKESMGGHHYASAYCLVYVDLQRSDLFEETKESEMTSPDCLEWLPEDLQKYVEQDNNLFLQEIEQWDLEQSRKKDSSTMTTLGGCSDIECSIVAEKKMVIVDENLPFATNLAMEHAGLVLKSTLSKVEQLSKTIDTHGPQSVLEEALKQETSRLRRLARLPNQIHEDSRLQHVGVYILQNAEIPDIFLNWSVLEQFTLPDLDDKPRWSPIRRAAIQKLEVLKHSLSEQHHKTYQTLHEEYDKFRRMVTFFVVGVDNYYKERYDVALTHFIESCRLNNILVSSPSPGKNKGLNPLLLAHYRRQSVLKINEITATRFQEQSLSEAVQALSEAYEHVLPCMEFLTSEGYVEDIKAVESIRNRWCGLLGGEKLEPQKGEKLQDFLAKLFNDQPSNLQGQKLPPPIRLPALDEKFHNVMLIAAKNKDYEIALQTK